MARRTGLVAILIALLAVTAPTIDAARQSTPVVASPATQDNGEMLDLPAMLLQPADLVAVGLGEEFGIYGGNPVALDEAVENAYVARGDVSGERLAEFTTVLEDAGFRQGYSLDLGTPADTPVGVGVQVTSEIDEYADAAGAAVSFAFFTDKTEFIDIEFEEIAGARRFGDQSLTQRARGVAPGSGAAYQGLIIEARVGRLTPSVSVVDYSNQPPDLAVAEALMERLLERVTHEARPASGEPSYTVARLDGEGVATVYDSYGRFDGVTLPYVGDTAETLASREVGFSTTRDIYYLGQSVPAGADGTQDDVRYIVQHLRFASAEVATAWLDGYLFGLADRPAVAGMPPLGDWAITFVDEEDRGNGIKASGFETYLRSGKDVVLFDVHAGPGIEQAGYAALLTRNADCLHSGPCIDPGPVPQDLISRGEIATPEAGSSGAQVTPAV